MRTEVRVYIISIKCGFLCYDYKLNAMSLYWNGKLVRKIFADDVKKKSKYRINTNIGRFYFYFEENKSSEQPSISGRLVFFPKNNQ